MIWFTWTGSSGAHCQEVKVKMFKTARVLPRRCPIGLVYSQTKHLLFKKDCGFWYWFMFVWKIDVWDSVKPLARPSRVVGFGGRLSFATLSPFWWGLSNTVFVCLSRSTLQIQRGSMSTFVDREPNSHCEASDVAALISSLFPGIQSLVPTVIWQ